MIEHLDNITEIDPVFPDILVVFLVIPLKLHSRNVYTLCSYVKSLSLCLYSPAIFPIADGMMDVWKIGCLLLFSCGIFRVAGRVRAESRTAGNGRPRIARDLRDAPVYGVWASLPMIPSTAGISADGLRRRLGGLH